MVLRLAARRLVSAVPYLRNGLVRREVVRLHLLQCPQLQVIGFEQQRYASSKGKKGVKSKGGNQGRGSKAADEDDDAEESEEEQPTSKKGGKAVAKKGKKAQGRNKVAEPESDDEEEDSGGKNAQTKGTEEVVLSLDDVANVKELQARLSRVVEGLNKDFSTLRGGRADPAMFDHLIIDSYGQQTPLGSVAQVSLKGPHSIVLTCYDAALAPAVIVAVRDCGMNLNPQKDGNRVFVPIPKASLETREAMVKVAAKQTEKAKVHMRGIRHKVLEKLKENKALFSKDDVHKRNTQIDALVTSMEAACTTALEAKKKEILNE